VGRAQTILNGNNAFDNDWLRGTIDHVFGTETGNACRRGKYWIGYPEEDILPTYGPTFDAYLTGEAELTPQMLARIEDRMGQLGSIGERMINQAVKHIGEKERTGDNDIWVTDWYGIRGPWCAMLLSWCGVVAGSKAFAKGTRPPSGLHWGSGTYAYVPFIVSDARFGANGLQVVSAANVKRGDIVCFDWDGGVADHTGFFDAWVDKAGGYFKTVEGNTSPDDSGNQSNGGGIFRRGEQPRQGDTRRLGQVEAFVRVGK
jgi:hypothetical protein